MTNYYNGVTLHQPADVMFYKLQRQSKLDDNLRYNLLHWLLIVEINISQYT